jgi:hypothetical protein
VHFGVCSATGIHCRHGEEMYRAGHVNPFGRAGIGDDRIRRDGDDGVRDYTSAV